MRDDYHAVTSPENGLSAIAVVQDPCGSSIHLGTRRPAGPSPARWPPCRMICFDDRRCPYTYNYAFNVAVTRCRTVRRATCCPGKA